MSSEEMSITVNFINETLIKAEAAMAEVISAVSQQVIGGKISKERVNDLVNYANRITAMNQSLRAMLPKVR